MKNLFRLVLFLMPVMLFSGCSASKALSKRGYELERAGLSHEAADFYYMALQRDPRNVDARIGLNKVGKEVLDKELDEFFKSNGAGDHKQAVYAYQDAKEYRDKLNIFINLSIPSYHQELYRESLNKYLGDRYIEAEELMYEEKYRDADEIYREIVKLDPDYKDAAKLLSLTTAEPMYQKGIEAFESGKYHESYLLMKKIIDDKGSYKDAIDYKRRAKERATQTIAVTEVKGNNTAEQNFANLVQGKLVTRLVNTQNPFLQVVDRRNTDRILKEQRLNMTLSAGRETRVQAGEILGADLLVTGELVNLEINEGKIERYRSPADQTVRVKRVNPRTRETYMASTTNRVQFDEYYGEKVFKTGVRVQVVNTQTGEVVWSDVIHAEVKDKVHYARYNGDYRSLNPVIDTSEGFRAALKQAFSSSARQEFYSMFTQDKRKYRSSSEMSAELADRVANTIAGKMEKMNSAQL